MTRYERWTLWASALTTGLTGIGFFWTKYLVEAADPWAVVHHPLEPWLLKLHIVASPVFIFAVGMIATRHILVHLRSRVRRGRRSGMALVWLLVPMAGSGYLIQVVSAETWTVPLAAVHILTGAAFLLAIGAHRLGIAPVVRTRPGSVAATDRGDGPARSPSARERLPSHGQEASSGGETSRLSARRTRRSASLHPPRARTR